jgi:glycosyltransferase involved in cell wall biosynthesis
MSARNKSDPRRIAYVLRVFPKFSETFITSELAELKRRGIELRILSLAQAEGLRHQIIADAGLDQITCYEPNAFLSVLQEFRPQLLHAHFATEATAAAIDLAGELDVPFTFTAHGYDIHRKAPPDFSARAAAASAVVTVSRANGEYLAQHFAVPRGHIRVIPCGIDTEFFKPPRPEPATIGHNNGAAAGPPVILCVARHVEVKNLAVLLQGCARLRDRGLLFQCVIVGDGPCRTQLETTQAELRLNGVVQMPGAAEQSEVRRCWQRASIGVLSSDNEGMPVSLMEAAACGVPVVSTDVGGVAEMVQDGVTGLLVPPRDPAALGTALERLLLDEALRAKLGSKARERAEECFSVRRQVDQLLALWSEILASRSPSKVFVSDRFNALADPELPSLRLALEPVEAKRQLKRRLQSLAGPGSSFRLKAIRVVRHKPGRRCVIEYEARLERPGMAGETVTMIGKTRVRRFGKEGYRLQELLWRAGFDSRSADGISVPEPVGVIPRFQMWLQQKVAGPTATTVLPGPEGVELARRIADAVHKLHQANVPTARRHTMADELRILHECLAKVAARKPDWSARLSRVAQACDTLGGTLPEPCVCGIHRDFYPAQVVVASESCAHSAGPSGARLYLIDFDLYCLGDPALDVGNFLGHMTEQALRELGNARGMADREQALEERFLALAGETSRQAVRAYATLTLIRHIYLSDQSPERMPFSAALLALCEERLGLLKPGNCG